jgi:hypothetical protein
VIALVALAQMMTAPSFKDPRAGMAGEPRVVAQYVREARHCGYKVTVRPLRDKDLVERPNSFLPGSQIVLFDQPYNRHDPRAPCFVDAEERRLRSNPLHFSVTGAPAQ